jgi:uncharacterized membrane protein SpoIIM required for sporulation
MDALNLKSHRFRAEREANWKKLESLLNRFERGRGAELSDEEVVSIPVLYRAALSSLSAARAVSLDQNLIAYLESLSTRAYFCVYGTRSTLGERALRFFTRDWPEAVRKLWRETAISALFGLLGTFVAFVMVRSEPQWYYAFVSHDMAEGRDPSASAKGLHDILFETHGATGLSYFSSALFTHNAETAILAFALGFACCLPSAFLVFLNGLTLGALYAVYVDRGLGVELGGWLFIHGVTELFAITLAGAAGFRIGWALAFPGKLGRLDAMIVAGREAGLVMVGVVVMLAIAGLLEGFGRQLITVTALRYAIAATTALGWGSYFYLYRRRA